MDDRLPPVAQSLPEGAPIVSELLSFESFFDAKPEPCSDVSMP